MLVSRTLQDKAALFISTMRELSAGILLFGLYNVLLTVLLEREFIIAKPEGGFLNTLGITMTFFIQFANNQAYSRWWEARQLWGGIVNISRTLPIWLEGAAESGKVLSEEQKFDICQRHIAYIRLVCHQLRRDRLPSSARAYLREDELKLMDFPNPAVHLSKVQSAAINKLYQDGLIDSYARVNLLSVLGRCMDLQGACERIKTTQFPPTYKLFLRLILMVFLGVMPFQNYADYGIFAPIPSVIAGAAFLALERFGTDLEDPFEGLENDCAMLAICDTIQKDVLGPDFYKHKHRLSSKVCVM